MEQKTPKKYNYTKKTGRPEKYNSGILKKIDEYVELKKSQNKIPTSAGFATYIEVHKDTIQAWRAVHKKFSLSIARMLSLQEEMLIEGALYEERNPNFTQFLLKNNHGYRDKQETDITTNGKDLPTPITPISTEVKK